MEVFNVKIKKLYTEGKMTLIWTDQDFISWATTFVFDSELLSSWGWYWPTGNVDWTE